MFAKALLDLPLSTTPYLAGLVAVLFVLSFAMLFCEAQSLARVRRRFCALPRFQQVLLVLFIGVMTASAQKSGTNEVADVANEILDAEDEVGKCLGESGSMASASPTLLNLRAENSQATNVFAITSFAVNCERRVVSFKAAWPSNFFDSVGSRNVDLFSSTNLLERRWTPLAAFTMPPNTNAYAFTVSSNNVAAWARSQFLDTFAGLGFYRFGLDIDSDHDGLTDTYETLWSFTDPLDADFDNDGLVDSDELAVGTDPFTPDTDGDGVKDGAEVAHFEVILPDDVLLPEFDLSAATNLLVGSRTCTSAQFPVVLPFAFTGGGIVHTNATIDLDGVVAFHPTATNAPLTLSSRNVNLETASRFPYHTVVMPYWDALRASPLMTPGTRILMDDIIAFDGRRYWVVEYENIRLAATGIAEGQVATFQVFVCEDEPNTVYVRYVHLASAFDGTSATIGAQLAAGGRVMQLSFNVPVAIADGMVIVYRFGAGTDPLTAEDTDHDGIPDGREISLGSDPLQPDSDGDGMNDGWEFDCGLNPMSATGEDGADGDPDNDGLSNIDEYQNDCDPRNADTDGDGITDGVEINNGANPNDSSDGGVAAATENFRELSFNIYGDYAAWEMTIQGLGPDDTWTRRISMGAPNAQQNVTQKMRKGNSYRLSMRWLNSDGHTDLYCWYCWQARIDGHPSASSYQDYSTTRLAGSEVVVGNGWIAENADGLLTSHVHMHDLDEDLRIRVRITPAVETLDLCKQALGDKIRVKTAGTCLTGVEVSLDESTFVKTGGVSELRFSLSRERVKALGLLPANDDDDVNEIVLYDIGEASSSSQSNLSDSQAIKQVGYAFRGQILQPSLGNLDSSPPVSKNSESFYKAAGCEIVTACFAGRSSAHRQIMNQADYFYYSGHGWHREGSLVGLAGGPRLTPSLVSAYWNRDLKCVIVAGCSVLDINDYNGNFEGSAEHLSSPGSQWARIKDPESFLGYAYKAPLDTQGSAEIANAWVANRVIMSDADAWMSANNNRKGRNACAIQRLGDSQVRYSYFKRERGFLYNSYLLTNVIERITQ